MKHTAQSFLIPRSSQTSVFMEAQYSEHGAPLAHLELCVLLERLCAGLAPWPQVEGVHSGGHDTQQLHLLTQQGHTLCTLHCVKLTLNALVVVTHGMESFFLGVLHTTACRTAFLIILSIPPSPSALWFIRGFTGIHVQKYSFDGSNCKAVFKQRGKEKQFFSNCSVCK